MKNLKKISALLLALIICFACFSGGTAFAAKTVINTATTNNDFAKMTAEIIKNEDTSSMLRIIGKISKKPSYSVFSNAKDAVISKDGRFVLQFSSEKKLISCLEELNKNPDIIYAERDRPIYTEALELADEYLSWGVEAIEADIYSQKIAPSVSDRSITVAIVDSGSEDIDFIKDNLVPGYDFFENDSDAFQDESVDSHGTFLASIVADCTRNLPVKIMPVRVLGSKDGSLINVINGIRYAADNGADVINISLGAILNNCKSLEDAINYAEEKNICVVVCAGNMKIDIKNFCPAHIENVLTVSSVNEKYEFSESFSNFGNGVDLAAPGENITGYNASGEITNLSGTSMSAAFVSAAAAMFLLENPDCNTKQIRDSLTACAKDYGNTGWDKFYGHGVLKLSNIEKPEIPEITATLKIKNNPGNKTINYGDILRLTAEVTNQPENTSVWWYVDGIKTGEGETFEVSPESGSVNVTAKLVDTNGVALKDSDGNEISDSETVTVNSGFFQKIISFFKNLFRSDRSVVQFFIYN